MVLSHNFLQKFHHFKFAGTILKHFHLSTLTWGVVQHVWIDDYSSHSFIHLLYLFSPALRVTGVFCSSLSVFIYLLSQGEGRVHSWTSHQSNADAVWSWLLCIFVCDRVFVFFVFFFSIRSLEQRSLHGWLLLLGSKEPRYQASSFLFAFMSTVCVLGLSCRQVFSYYHNLLILTWKWNEGAGSHFAILEAIATEA